MSQELSFWRKVIYVGGIVLLLFPLFWIGQPATRSSAGGVLARLRTENDLSQAALGEIDPAGESIKLATLGLRNVAVVLLWERSFECKKREDWEGLSVALNQITKLQPNFITVWEHQSHNLSYNVSVEFDDYRMRYHWVKKGIGFLVEGIHLNRENPRLVHYTGWITGQKIGRADEHVQFRELFRKDDDFHNSLNREVTIDRAFGWDGRADNWLVSRLWYQRAERAVDSGIPLKGKSPLIFHADNPMALINYSSTIEDEGVLGQTAQLSWSEADRAWGEYGRRPIPTSWGHNVRLGEYDEVNGEIVRLKEQLEQLAPGVRQRIRQEKVAQLTPELLSALDVPEEKLTEENYRQHLDAKAKTSVGYQEVAQRTAEQNRETAKKVADRLVEMETLSSRIAHYRGIVNYEYWSIRCAAEQTKTAVDAREFLYKAKQAYDAVDLENAKKQFESSWLAWRKIYDQYPRLMDDVSAEELADGIKQYQRLLQQLDEEFPADFPLVDLLKLRQDRDAALKEMYQKMGGQPGSERDSSTGKEPPQEPKPEPAKPDAADAKPNKEPPPDAETAKPEAKVSKPESKPAAEAAKPAAEEAKPADAEAKPATDDDKPPAGAAKPEVEPKPAAEPAKAEVEPKSAVEEGKSEPAPDAVKS